MDSKDAAHWNKVIPCVHSLTRTEDLVEYKRRVRVQAKQFSDKLSINDELDIVAMLFDLANKCPKAEEGRIFTHKDRETVTDAAKAKSKDVKHKGPAVLAVEPDQKCVHDREEAPKKPFCAYHNMNSHNTEV
ncbi:hypothetical protein D1007_59378 [Hordeum vulgare]|nr:hypothetical protein D1007_59378 [Hordeum vulgare]